MPSFAVQLFMHGLRDQQPPEKIPKNIELTEKRERDERGGIPSWRYCAP